MNKFRFRNKKIKIILIIIFFIVTTYTYIVTFINRNFNKVIIDSINFKYNNSFIIKNELLYYKTNKEVNSLNEENNDKLVEIINNTEDKIMENNNEKKLVYIYNSHDTEKYSLFYDNDYSITPDVKIASYILKDYLNDLGVNSYVETKSINDYLNKQKLSYKGAYEASRYYLKEELKNNDYKIFIDIHRDSVKRKYTLFEYDNKKYAKVLFVLTTKHNNYKENEEFVNSLNDKLNKRIKGVSRGIMKRKDVIFNQDISKYSTLIELGGVDNTLEEINNTLELLASILKEYIDEENI